MREPPARVFGGAIFSVVLGIAERRRTFDQMSLPRFAAWGALGGLLLSIFMFTTVSAFDLVNVIVYGVVVLLGAGSAAGSLALASWGLVSREHSE